MKSKPMTELIEVSYWSCAEPTHRHKTKAVAEACIAKSNRPKEARRKWTRPMIGEAMEAVLSGASFAAAGGRYGVSGARIAQVIHKAQRMMTHPSNLDEPGPPHNFYSITEVRANADFWRRQLSRFLNDA